ncbi:mitochondrial dynamics protein MID49 [Pangasianodon hypophthalmus]|uniref:mitochondrial dynamics protein MID49 n=1 Tax=Pangasianodon hypophthalmus TaxID=310915 RepID=UPI00230733C1|nr:mitochondrial dynamics protein MID49 [Pangasianodon hypophthalmus]XP_034155871.2 mitochondrial dynamics protein MID49 [Pangasianodon hypophthalmus]XP_053086026.1 mitochondrial dynamics protein MID49 [Pangasianodon hypophthalmus]
MYYSSKRRDGISAIIDFLLSNARLVLGVGGVAVLGIATLAVKKLIERAGRPPDDENPDKKMTESWEELSLVSSSPKLLQKGIEGVVMKQIAAATKKEDLSQSAPQSQSQTQRNGSDPAHARKRLDLCVLTFSERLEQYYRTRVCLSPSEVSRAQQRALDIATEIQGFLHAKHPDMPLGEMTLAGSLLDDLQVVKADHACLLVPLQMEPSLWTPIAGEDTFLGHPQYCMLRRQNLEYFPRGRSYWDRHLLGGYLSSQLVAEQLRKSITESMNWPSLSGTLECEVRPVLGSPALKLEIRAPSESRNFDEEQLFISILPTVRLGDMTLTAQPEITGSFDYVWYQSLYTSETARLASLDQSDEESGVRRKCLKTLKAVCRNCPALHKLTGAQLSNVILHMSEKEFDWSESAFADRFQQAIAELIGYLETGFLPSYFKPAVNLLQGFTEDDIDEMGFMLYCAVSEPEILLI